MRGGLVVMCRLRAGWCVSWMLLCSSAVVCGSWRADRAGQPWVCPQPVSEGGCGVSWMLLCGSGSVSRGLATPVGLTWLLRHACCGGLGVSWMLLWGPRGCAAASGWL